MIRSYVDEQGRYKYLKIAERLLECDWKLAERNREYLTYEEMNRYKIVTKALNDLEKEELRALAIRYYMPKKFRNYGRVIPTTYPKTAEMLGLNRYQCDKLITRALSEFGKLFIHYWEEEVKEIELKQ